jgi:ribosome-binding protein aMBF1 (putative translation factor)
LLVTAKLAVYEAMRISGWSRAKLAAELGVTENAVRRLLDLRHNSHLWVIDDALARMGRRLSIELAAESLDGRAA